MRVLSRSFDGPFTLWNIKAEERVQTFISFGGDCDLAVDWASLRVLSAGYNRVPNDQDVLRLWDLENDVCVCVYLRWASLDSPDW